MKIASTPKSQGYRFDPKQHGVSQSMLSTWLTCRRLAWLKIVKGLRPRGTAKPLIFGSVAHDALEVTTSRIKSGKIIGKPKALAEALTNLAPGDVRDAVAVQERLCASTAERDYLEEVHAILGALLPQYWLFWGPRDVETEWLLLESTFRVDAGTAPIVGKYDGVMRRKGSVSLFETKTKSKIMDSLLDVLGLDLQVGLYLVALTADHPKWNPTKAVYNIIRKPGERRGKSETLKAFAARIAKKAAKDPAHYFVRYHVEMTHEERVRHVRHVEALVAQFVQWWRYAKDADDELAWNSGACETKYGTCEFLSYCSRGDTSQYRTLDGPHPELR